MNLISINSIDMPVVEYRGHRVVTLAMVDQVHERPEGTAGRNFREHREKLIEGADYIQISSDEIRRNNPGAIPDALRRNDVVLLTEQGYLMIVKSLTDDLAWDVQRQLVNRYFRPASAALLPEDLPTALRLAADLAEEKAALALVNQKQAAKIESLENLFMDGETPFQFAKRLNGVNCSLISHALMDMGWVFNDADPKSRPHYRVYSAARAKKWLNEKPRTIRGEGESTFVRYDLVLLLDGAKRLHHLYMNQKLPMKKTWDGRFSYIKFTPETSL